MLLASLVFWEPLKLTFAADLKSGKLPADFVLESGDSVVLDAASAVINSISSPARQVDFLKGAGFFDVTNTGARFIVKAGDVSIEALGTAFEVLTADDTVIVSVAEGRVEVRSDGNAVQLAAGERIRIEAERLNTIEEIPLIEVAEWRSDRLTVDGLTLGEVAHILDRRLASRILIIGDVSKNRLLGGINLSEPKEAVDTLATMSGVRVIAFPGLITFFPAN
ncbi:MAG: FecR domain-containing protein [Pseudomonadota bacterium]